MKILSDLTAVVSALTNIVVNTTEKTDQIISNTLDVGVAATGEWKQDAEYEALEAQLARQDKLEAYQAKKAARKAKKDNKK